MTPRPNAHGIYEPTENLALPRDVKGWRGCNTADIDLANLGTHWIWSTGFQLMNGDCWGSAGPLWNDERHSAPTRDAAIDAASADLRARLVSRSDEYADVRRIMAWLDRLQPVQMELFAA
ncbi:hypothetical protein [Sphingomonas koreensis]